MLRIVISVVLLIAFFWCVRGLFFIPTIIFDSEVGLSAHYYPQEVPTSEYIKVVFYWSLALVVAVGSFLGAMALYSRWRLVLGIVLIVFGLGSILQLPQAMMERGEPFIPIEAIIWLLVGIGLVVYQTRRDKKANAV